MPAELLKKDDLKATAEGLPEEEEEEGGNKAKLKPVIGGAFVAISLDSYPQITGRLRGRERREHRESGRHRFLARGFKGNVAFSPMMNAPTPET